MWYVHSMDNMIVNVSAVVSAWNSCTWLSFRLVNLVLLYFVYSICLRAFDVAIAFNLFFMIDLWSSICLFMNQMIALSLHFICNKRWSFSFVWSSASYLSNLWLQSEVCRSLKEWCMYTSSYNSSSILYVTLR